jgi:Flp pilus assembly protein TadD
MAGKARFGVIACAGLLLGPLLLAGCTPEPARDPVLVADPPLGPSGSGNTVDEGAAQTEIERGAAYIQNEKYAEAKAHFEKALAMKPSPSAWTYLGIADDHTGDHAGAEKAFKSALELDPTFPEAAQNLAALYLDDPPRPDEAIAVLKPVIAKTPDPGLLQNLAFAYGLKGDVEAAGRAYQAAISTKGDEAAIRLAWGTLLLDQKQGEKAAEQLKKALDVAKEDAAMLASLGRALGVAKAYGECVRALDRAVKLKPGEAELLVRRGTCKHELEDEGGARADYEAAIKLSPKFAAAHYYLGRQHLVQKQRVKATTELELASKLDGDGPIGKAARAKLEEMKDKDKKKGKGR